MLVDDLQMLVNTHVQSVDGASAVGGLDDLVAMREALDRLEASWTLAVAAADARGDLDAGALSASEWMALHCRRSMSEARSVLRFAKRLSYTQLVREAFVDGTLSAQQAHVFVRGLSKKHAVLFAEHEAMLIESAQPLNVAQLEQLMAHWYRRADDDLADTEDRCAHAGREVFLSPVGNQWALKGTLTAEQGSIVHEALASVMQGEWEKDNDERTAAQRRADALESICRRILSSDTTSISRGARPHIEVHVDLDDLVALASATSEKTKQKFGGFTPEGMWLSGVTIERMCCDAVISQVVMTGAGPVSTGRVTRTIPTHRRRQVVARDRHCRYPGCHRPAAWSEVHHIHHWEHGGTHDLNNLLLLCVRHHHRVHNHNESLVLHPDDRVDVIGIDGITRTSHPPPKLKHALRKRTRTAKRVRKRETEDATERATELATELAVKRRAREQDIAEHFEYAIARLFETQTSDPNQPDQKSA